MNDLISVIIPVYKVEEYLCRCVDSVLAQTYGNLEIILVDDEIVQDSFMQEVLSMSAPQGVKVEVRSAADAAAELSEDTSEDNVMLLFKELKYAGLLVNYGYPLEELDIGNIGSAPGRKAITKEVYISDAEKDIVRGLHEKNINVYIQKLPQDAQVDIMKKI